MSKLILKLAMVAGLTGFSGLLNATSIDLRNELGNGGGFGNSLTFSNDGISVNVSSYAETGAASAGDADYYYFESAEVYSWDIGLGICTQLEGTSHNGCTNIEHEIDTAGRDELLVFQFDQVVNFEQVVVDPYQRGNYDPNDRDIIYWVGNADSLPNLSLDTFLSLSSLPGFGAETHSAASSGYDGYTHQLSGTGNILLLAGNYHDRNCLNYTTSNDGSCEAYKITHIDVSAAVIPIPAAAWLFCSGLLGLAALRRKQ
jgi:hypothetical protein